MSDADATIPLQGISIVPDSEVHHSDWQALYRHYGEFYQSPITNEALAATWAWLLDPHHPQEGLIAIADSGAAVGLAHFRAFPKPMLGRDAGFLDDLFVDPGRRGLGVGRALIAAIADLGRARGWPLVRWITASDNATARRLYDGVAKGTSWVTYDLKL